MRPLPSTLGLFLALAANTGCAAAIDAPTFQLHTDDYQRVRGTWLLEDGHVVQVVGTRWHPRAEFDDGRTAPLVAASATDLRTPDGCTRLRFELNDNATLVRIRVTRACSLP